MRLLYSIQRCSKLFNNLVFICTNISIKYPTDLYYCWQIYHPAFMLTVLLYLCTYEVCRRCRLKMKSGTVISRLYITLAMEDENYLPDHVIVAGGDLYDMQTLSDNRIDVWVHILPQIIANNFHSLFSLFLASKWASDKATGSRLNILHSTPGSGECLILQKVASIL